jgi:hypothetical protein
MSGPYAITGAKTLGSNRVRKARKVKQKLTWKQRFRNWIFEENSDMPELVERDISSSELGGEGMRFQLYRAAGGYVVEIRYYDHKQDRHHHKLHIIKDDDDVGNAIGKIITMESLR